MTRTGVMVDRIASAWLIRRFIDRDARFSSRRAHGYEAAPGEIRFDMAEAEFTHERRALHVRGAARALLARATPPSRAIAEMVHDLDLEDGRHRRPETAGLGRMIVGIALATPEDEVRLGRGATVFDGLYESFRSTVTAAGAGT